MQCKNLLKEVIFDSIIYSKSIRRRFFNMFFSVIDPVYLLHLRKYDHLIKQKNNVLRILV